MMHRLLIALLLFCTSAVSVGQEATPEQEERAKALSANLRCLVCQNQTIAESNADLAKDLRNQVTEMVASGASDKEIVRYMVERYGDFVLYKPPVRPATYLLWAGPFILLMLGVLVLARVIVRRNKTVVDTTLSEAERRRLEALLREGAEGKKR